MQQRLVIVGAGFAGMYAALSAARLRDLNGVSQEALEIVVVASKPSTANSRPPTTWRRLRCSSPASAATH